MRGDCEDISQLWTFLHRTFLHGIPPPLKSLGVRRRIFILFQKLQLTYLTGVFLPPIIGVFPIAGQSMNIRFVSMTMTTRVYVYIFRLRIIFLVVLRDPSNKVDIKNPISKRRQAFERRNRVLHFAVRVSKNHTKNDNEPGNIYIYAWRHCHGSHRCKA